MMSRGFTLIELLVVMAISSVILGSVLGVFIASNKTYTIQDQRTKLQQDLRAAMSIMLKDMRMAGLNPTQNSAMPTIDSATATDISFYMDFVGNGTVRQFEYRYVPATQRMEVQWNGAGGFQRVAEGVTNMEFVYGSTSEGQTSTPANLADIRSATVTMCGQIRGAYADEVNARQIRTTHANGTVELEQAGDFCLTRTVNFRNIGL